MVPWPGAIVAVAKLVPGLPTSARFIVMTKPVDSPLGPMASPAKAEEESGKTNAVRQQRVEVMARLRFLRLWSRIHDFMPRQYEQ